MQTNDIKVNLLKLKEHTRSGEEMNEIVLKGRICLIKIEVNQHNLFPHAKKCYAVPKIFLFSKNVWLKQTQLCVQIRFLTIDTKLEITIFLYSTSITFEILIELY